MTHKSRSDQHVLEDYNAVLGAGLPRAALVCRAQNLQAAGQDSMTKKQGAGLAETEDAGPDRTLVADGKSCVFLNP